MRILRPSIVVILFPVLGIIHGYAQGGPASQNTPKLEHFDISMVDKTLDPCQDFYKYACSKWNAANPIPADQVAWGTGSGLQYWNENILRDALEKAAAPTSNRTDYEQKIGDYWAACMDESGIEAAGTRDLKPELERIAQMTSKSQLADQVAHIHQAVPGAWQGDDNQSRAALLGFGQTQDFDDASRVVAAIDQGGLGLPNRDFYIKDDDKSKEIRGEYETHIKKMLVGFRRKPGTISCRCEDDHCNRNRHGASADGQCHAARSQELEQQDEFGAGAVTDSFVRLETLHRGGRRSTFFTALHRDFSPTFSAASNH